jgi:hypothetical protein
LLKLGTGGKGTVRDIFTDAQTSLRKPTNLKTLVSEIDKLDWFSARTTKPFSLKHFVASWCRKTQRTSLRARF